MRPATLEQTLAPITSAPSRAAILLDVDGTLAPIVADADAATVPPQTSAALARVARRYAVVACVTGRRPLRAREMVGLRQIAYYGNHGSEFLAPGAEEPEVSGDAARWQAPVREFAQRAYEAHGLGSLGIRTEDKGPIAGLHWRGVDDEDRAEREIRAIAEEALAAGLGVHWAKKILEIRPPIVFSKGTAAAAIVADERIDAAVFVGDDLTDLEAFAALDEALAGGALRSAVKVGVDSAEAPPGLAEAVDFMLSGTDDVRSMLELLAAA